MWTKSHSIITKEVTKEQMWKLFSDVNTWNTWDQGIESAQLEGKFEAGNIIFLKPKGGPNLKVELLEVEPDNYFLDVTKFFGAKMYDDHKFEETPDGLKITNTISVEGPLSFFWIKIVAQNLVDSLPKDMEIQIKSATKLLKV